MWVDLIQLVGSFNRTKRLTLSWVIENSSFLNGFELEHWLFPAFTIELKHWLFMDLNWIYIYLHLPSVLFLRWTLAKRVIAFSLLFCLFVKKCYNFHSIWKHIMFEPLFTSRFVPQQLFSLSDYRNEIHLIHITAAQPSANWSLVCSLEHHTSCSVIPLESMST